MFPYLRYPTMHWKPLLEIQRVQARMNRLLEDLESPGEQEYPPIELWSGEDGLRLRALLPGFESDDLDVSVVGDTLTLKATREAPAEGEKHAWHRRELEHGRFVRTLQLPYSIDADKVEAAYRHGVLDVDLPRSESEKPRRIAVKAGS